MSTPLRAVLDEDDKIVEIVGLEDKWNWTPPKGLKIGKRTNDELVVGGHWDGEKYHTPPKSLKDAVNGELQRRLVSGFIFKGVEFQNDKSSRDEIAAKKTEAFHAMTLNKDHESLGFRWLNTDEDFAWIASDNSRVKMTAEECYAFGVACSAYHDALRSHARILKDLDPIPGDYADDRHWPNKSLD